MAGLSKKRAFRNSGEALPGVGKDAFGRADEVRPVRLVGEQGDDEGGRVGQGDARGKR